MRLTIDDIYFHNDFYDMVLENPEHYKYEVVRDVAFKSIGHRKKLLDFIFKKFITISYENIILFKLELIEYGMYDEYKKNIIKGDDNFLKSCLVLYFEPDLKDELFKNNKDIVDTVVKSNENDLLKLSNLINVSQFKCDENTYSLLKEQFKNLLYSYNKNITNEEKEKLLNNYYTLMDNNQINLGNSKILKNE